MKKNQERNQKEFVMLIISWEQEKKNAYIHRVKRG